MMHQFVDPKVDQRFDPDPLWIAPIRRIDPILMSFLIGFNFGLIYEFFLLLFLLILN